MCEICHARNTDAGGIFFQQHAITPLSVLLTSGKKDAILQAFLSVIVALVQSPSLYLKNQLSTYGKCVKVIATLAKPANSILCKLVLTLSAAKLNMSK